MIRAGALSAHFRIPDPPRRRWWWDRWAPIARGLAGVVLLVVTAVDALVTALLGIRPLAPVVRRLGTVLADEYRVRAAGAVDAEVDDDQEREVWR